MNASSPLFYTIDSLNRSECERLHNTYRKTKQLGRGAYATVFEACRRESSECPYVVKVMTYDAQKFDFSGGVDRLSRPYFMRQWKLELLLHARVLNCERRYKIADIPDQYAPRVYDAWFCDEPNGDTTFYILMQKFDGTLVDFVHRFRRNKLVYTVVQLALANLANALDTIHRDCRICLNDIKPENILYKETENVNGGKVSFMFSFSDFGKSTRNATRECTDEDQRRFHQTISAFLKDVENL